MQVDFVSETSLSSSDDESDVYGGGSLPLSPPSPPPRQRLCEQWETARYLVRTEIYTSMESMFERIVECILTSTELFPFAFLVAGTDVQEFRAFFFPFKKENTRKAAPLVWKQELREAWMKAMFQLRELPEGATARQTDLLPWAFYLREEIDDIKFTMKRVKWADPIEAIPPPEDPHARWKVLYLWKNPNQEREPDYTRGGRHRAHFYVGAIPEEQREEAQGRVLNYMVKHFLYAAFPEGDKKSAPVWLKKRDKTDPEFQKGASYWHPIQDIEHHIPNLLYEEERPRSKAIKNFKTGLAEMLKACLEFKRTVFDIEHPNPALLVTEDHMGSLLNMFQGTTQDLPKVFPKMGENLRHTSWVHYLWHLYVVRAGGNIYDFLFLVLVQIHIAQNVRYGLPYYIRFQGSQKTLKTSDARLSWLHIPPLCRKAISHIKDLTGDRTVNLEHVLAVIMDEAQASDDHDDSRIKELSTAGKIRQRIIYQEAREVEKNFFIVFTGDDLETNEYAAKKGGERRQLVLFAKDPPFKVAGALSKDAYLNFWHNYVFSGVISDEYHKTKGLEICSHQDLLQMPGALSWYAFRLMVPWPHTNPFMGCNPSNREILRRQLQRIGEKQPILSLIIQKGSAIEGGVLPNAWDPEHPDFGRWIKRIVLIEELYQWKEALSDYGDMANLLYAHYQIDLPDLGGLWPQNLETHLACLSDLGNHIDDCDLNFPVLNVEGDPYLRDGTLLALMRGLWTVSSVRSTRAVKIRREILALPDDVISVYKRLVGRLLLLDKTLTSAKGADMDTVYKAHVFPQKLLRRLATLKGAKGSWDGAWDALCGRDTVKSVAALSGEYIPWHQKMMLVQNDRMGFFANHVWKLEGPRAHIHREERSNLAVHAEVGNLAAGQPVLYFVPCWAALQEQFLREVNAEIPFIYEETFIIDEFNFQNGLSPHLNPWEIVEYTAEVLLKPESWTNVRDLARQVFLHALEKPPPEKKDFQLESHRERSQAHRDIWREHDKAGFANPLTNDMNYHFIALPKVFDFNQAISTRESPMT